MFVKNLEDLLIYKLAVEAASEVHALIKGIPRYWTNEECKQLLESSRSVPSNISEGFGRRFYKKQFIYFLDIAKGSSDESQTHLFILLNSKLIGAQAGLDLMKKYKNICVKIINLQTHLRIRDDQ